LSRTTATRARCSAAFLELEGFDVHTAANGRQALDSLKAGDPASVILLDLMMPVMDGWQFRRAQSKDPALSHIPVVVVTAAGRAEKIPAIERRRVASEAVDLRSTARNDQPLCDPSG
jgi:CheY-like chemotaxis protein